MDSTTDRALADLAVELTTAESVDASIALITAFAAQTLGTAHAGATLIRRGGRSFETAGPTDALVARADHMQNELGEGACIDAAVESKTVMSPDLGRDQRWPRWGPGTAALGLGSILSTEMHAGDHRIGALNVYGPAGHEFSQEDIETAHLLAHHASAALASAETIEGLNRALDSRTLIGQAQGVLMERYAIDADRAFAILRRHSQDENTRLVDVARALVERPRTPHRHG